MAAHYTEKNMQTKMASRGTEQDWQCNKKVLERNKFMLENDLATDVVFSVSASPQERTVPIKAHKYMLISASPVFWSMFSGDFCDGDDVNVNDIEPEAFKEMLRFIYTEEPVLTGSNVMHILHAAKKYRLLLLVQKCVDFLDKELSTNNACIVLEHSRFFGEEDLAKKCIDIIARNPAKALSAKDFMSISQATLTAILENDYLNIQEIKLFEYCCAWARGKCTRGVAIRSVLGDAVYKIRFPIMSGADFTDKVCVTEVLNQDEKLGILQYITSAEKNNKKLAFCCEARKSLPAQYYRR